MTVLFAIFIMESFPLQVQRSGCGGKITLRNPKHISQQTKAKINGANLYLYTTASFCGTL